MTDKYSTTLLDAGAILSHRYSNITWRGAPSNDEIDERCYKVGRSLSRKPKEGLRPDFSQMMTALGVLECTANRPCHIGCCPRCNYTMQRWLTGQIVNLSRAGSPVGAVTIVPSTPLLNFATATDFRKMMTDTRKKVESTGLVKWAVLCLDVSWNEHLVAPGQAVGAARFGWRPHVHGFFQVSNIRAFKDALSELFPVGPTVPVPVKTASYDGSAYGASYVLKGHAVRRSSYIDTKTNTFNARDYRLTGALQVESMLAFAELGLAGRIHLIGLKPKQNKTKEIVLSVLSETVG
jgi:hypothetical protein